MATDHLSTQSMTRQAHAAVHPPEAPTAGCTMNIAAGDQNNSPHWSQQ